MVLVLRPASKALACADAFAQAKLAANVCALLDVEHCLPAADFLQQIRAQTPDMFVVTSTYAAEFLCASLGKAQHSPDISMTPFLAIGKSTAAVLSTCFSKVQACDPACSEGLLMHPSLQVPSTTLAGIKHIALIKGQGGRDLIPTSLQARGFTLTQYDVYQRVRMQPPIFTQDFEASAIRAIIATSQEMIEAAFAYFDPNWLRTVAWIVASTRIKQSAIQHGVQDVSLSDGAHPEALIEAVKAREFI